MNIQFWLPFCISILVVSSCVNIKASRLLWIFAIALWGLFISNRGYAGADTQVYLGDIGFSSGLGLWIELLSSYFHILGLTLLDAQFFLYGLVTFFVAILPRYKFIAISRAWPIYLAFGGFSSDTSALRWSISFLSVVLVYCIAVVFQKDNTKIHVAMPICAALILAITGYPSACLLLFPPALIIICSKIPTLRLKLSPKTNKEKLMTSFAIALLSAVVLSFTVAIANRYLANLVHFATYIGLRFNIAKLFLSLAITSYIVCYYARFSGLHKIVGFRSTPLSLSLFYIPILFILFLSGVAWRFSSIFLITTTILGLFPSWNISHRWNNLASTVYPFMSILLVPISFFYVSSYVAQSSINDLYPIGSYVFP